MNGGRPSVYPCRLSALYVTEDTGQALERLAQSTGTTAAWHRRRALEAYLRGALGPSDAYVHALTTGILDSRRAK